MIFVKPRQLFEIFAISVNLCVIGEVEDKDHHHEEDQIREDYKRFGMLSI